jgi:CRISPR-associated endonuclease Cas2
MKMSKNSRIDFTRIILVTVGMIGLLSLAILVPNVMVSLKRLGVLDAKKYRPKNYLNKRIQLMLQNGLIQKIKKNGTDYLILTEKGGRKLNKYKILENKKVPQKWDKKWRVLIFDVWENRRNNRNMLRKEIKNYGFIKLQQSVWIYPYPCNEFIELLKTDLKFGKNVRYMIVQKIDNEKNLLKIFNIKR